MALFYKLKVVEIMDRKCPIMLLLIHSSTEASEIQQAPRVFYQNGILSTESFDSLMLAVYLTKQPTPK